MAEKVGPQLRTGVGVWLPSRAYQHAPRNPWKTRWERRGIEWFRSNACRPKPTKTPVVPSRRAAPSSPDDCLRGPHAINGRHRVCDPHHSEGTRPVTLAPPPRPRATGSRSRPITDHNWQIFSIDPMEARPRGLPTCRRTSPSDLVSGRDEDRVHDAGRRGDTEIASMDADGSNIRTLTVERVGATFRRGLRTAPGSPSSATETATTRST